MTAALNARGVRTPLGGSIVSDRRGCRPRDTLASRFWTAGATAAVTLPRWLVAKRDYDSGLPAAIRMGAANSINRVAGGSASQSARIPGCHRNALASMRSLPDIISRRATTGSGRDSLYSGERIRGR